MKNSGVLKSDLKKLFVLVSLLIASLIYAHGKKSDRDPDAPQHNKRPNDFKSSSLVNPKDMMTHSADMKKRAAEQVRILETVNEQGEWKATAESIDSHTAPEWFMDAKFGMFIDWGLWSVAGWAPKKETGAMYPDWYEYRMDTDDAFMAYHEKNWGADFKRDDFLPLFSASKYDPDNLIQTARRAGMKYVVPFCKHHGGFCLWPSSFTFRDAVDMGPQKDLIKPLVESCRREELKFGFYFSIEEWEYPILDADGHLHNRAWGDEIKPYTDDLDKKISGKIPVDDFGVDYLVPQAKEFIDLYDPDILWYDGDWNTNVERLHTYDIAAYFYNNAEGRKEVAVNDRYGGHPGEKWQRSKRGDFFTNEYGDMEKEAKQTIHAWEECRGISQSFGYNWQDTEKNVISSKAFIDMFVDIVAHGGNLLLIVNLDEQGALPKIQHNRLEDIGQWLKVNGEGIYATRPFYPYTSDSLAFTRSKDGTSVFVILKKWPQHELSLDGIRPLQKSAVTLLGRDEPLSWDATDSGTVIKFPSRRQIQKDNLCDYAWVVKIKVQAR